MKVSTFAGAAVAASILSLAGAAGAAQTCVGTCNAANMQCSSSGKDQSVCLNAWHQCKVGCAASSGATPKLKVTQPAPGVVVIKSAPPKPAKH